MPDVTIGPDTYRLSASHDGSQWIATAARADTGARHGIECAGQSEDESITRLRTWLEWQYDHAAALHELQLAEHTYHRTIAGSAFASAFEGPTPIEMQKESLEQVEAARRRLDEVRARRPE